MESRLTTPQLRLSQNDDAPLVTFQSTARTSRMSTPALVDTGRLSRRMVRRLSVELASATAEAGANTAERMEARDSVLQTNDSLRMLLLRKSLRDLQMAPMDDIKHLLRENGHFVPTVEALHEAAMDSCGTIVSNNTTSTTPTNISNNNHTNNSTTPVNIANTSEHDTSGAISFEPSGSSSDFELDDVLHEDPFISTARPAMTTPTIFQNDDDDDKAKRRMSLASALQKAKRESRMSTSSPGLVELLKSSRRQGDDFDEVVNKLKRALGQREQEDPPQ